MFLFLDLFLNSLTYDSEKALKKNIRLCFNFGEFVSESNWREHIKDFTKIMEPYINERQGQKTFKIPATVTLFDGKYEVPIEGIASFFQNMFRPNDWLIELYKEAGRRLPIPPNIRDNFLRHWFRQIETIIIPNSVTFIAYGAFDNSEQYTKNIKNIIIPDSVTRIDEYAFRDIPHIEYHGSASGAPWGAKSMN